MLLQCSLHVSEPPLDGCPPTRIWVWLDFGNIRLFLEKNIYVISEKWNDMFLSQNTDALQVFSLLLVPTLQHINKEDRRKAAASLCPSLFLFIGEAPPPIFVQLYTFHGTKLAWKNFCSLKYIFLYFTVQKDTYFGEVSPKLTRLSSSQWHEVELNWNYVSYYI